MKFIIANITIGVITVIYVVYVISIIKRYELNPVPYNIIAGILGFSFALTMALWVITMRSPNNSHK
ncbi:hypothetical protein [Picrophilus oshimae]|uniref:Uncharacterized protein n=1 Tax=Picrophilus torridus (strain ATCC 700027 / DSM 9790 / JCM 10055 / NBRC 100828 / KAW 2/3) TaxID=1122961 RepID=A0A8G2L776_PICTO|nr:hypothetical protein [Picrophilus oshimae]SMD30763.1 hypothetical protein SAMN02745355_0659 [Picrophilus oshimae DSM 9789]